ncbi:MAG: OsmC family protein [Planctomycetota bacterium]
MASDTPAAVAHLGAEGFAVTIDVHGHTVRADEPADLGGLNTGPDPFALLYASLSSCILITLRMYADRKQWPLRGADVRLFPTRRPAGPVERIDIELALVGEELTDAHRERLLDIAGKCPVHRSLEGTVEIDKTLV